MILEKSKTQWAHIRRTYGLTQEQYYELWTSSCPICLRDFDGVSVRPVVDHDHVSGAVRGVLCFFCNHRVVGRHRNPDILRRAADYLAREPRGWVVPKKKKKRRAKKK